MKKQKKLLFARNIFVFIVFICLGVIVSTEKIRSYLTTKFDKEINNYIETNYKDIKDTITKETSYQKGIYKTIISSKENPHLFFTIKKDHKKLTDTYQEDYLEGKTLLSYLEKSLKKSIKEKTNTDVSITIYSKLNEHTPSIQQRLLKEENLLELSFYTLEKDLLITNWSSSTIKDTIISTIEEYTSNQITPKNYTITIINKDNIKDTITIYNITEDFINNLSNEMIINDIINDRNTKLLKETSITYEYGKRKEK